jgi:hypothetical protein
MTGSVHPAVPIEPLTAALSGALGDDLVALYAYGSAVSGGFDVGVSDIDLLAVTRRAAAALDLGVVDRAHRSFLERHPDWENRLDIVYVGGDTLRSFRTSADELAIISPGEPLHLGGPIRDWLQNLFIVRTTGLRLLGPAPIDAIPEIEGPEFLSAIATYARWLAEQDLEAHAPGALAYAVLSECRALHTIRTEHPATKEAAAVWFVERAPVWGPIVEAALACRLTGGVAGFDDPAIRAAAAALVRHVAAILDPGPLPV